MLIGSPSALRLTIQSILLYEGLRLIVPETMTYITMTQLFTKKKVIGNHYRSFMTSERYRS